MAIQNLFSELTAVTDVVNVHQKRYRDEEKKSKRWLLNIKAGNVSVVVIILMTVH